jgi:endonuclease/exonuclease/phosphatase family metal-dependent hydrolase
MLGKYVYRWAPALVAGLVGAASCAHRPPMVAGTLKTIASGCHQVVPDRALSVMWMAPDHTRDVGRLGQWCDTVGPVLVESPADAAPAAAVEQLAIISWNVHVGGGDIEDVVKRLREGEFTDGRPVRHFVLLLQEAYREGTDVPVGIAATLPVPGAIVELMPDGTRRDIRAVAQSAGLHVFYAPAMRNGGLAAVEDRGSAILSTLPLADLQVIELPFERQRRIALAATIAGETTSRLSWRLRLADVHVDTSLALTRGGPFAARRRQTEALVEALTADPTTTDMPMVVGGDFNTWLGPKEPALEVMRRAFADTPHQPALPTWEGPLLARGTLDYVFARGPFRSAVTRRLAGRFGSDHYPLLTLVDF